MISEAQANRRHLLEVRTPNNNFDLYDSDRCLVTFSDGISGINVGPSVSRIDFFKVRTVTQTQHEGPKLHEDRELNAQITIPTFALFEALVGALQNLWSQQEQFLSSFDTQKQAMVQLLQSLQHISKADV